MMSVRKKRRVMKAAALLAVAALSCVSLFCVNRYFRGDSSAPVYTVPDEWHAYVNVADEKCDVSLEYSVKVLKTDRGMISIVPLFPVGTVFREIHMNDKPVVPVEQEGWLCAEVRKPGDYRIACRIDVKTKTVEGVTSCKIEKAGFVRSAVHVASDKELEFSIGGRQDTILGSAEGGTHGILYAGQRQDVEVRWRTPREQSMQQGVVSVIPSVVWTIKEKVLSADAVFDVTIASGARDRISLQLPKGASRIEIPKGMVHEWRENDSLVTMFFGRKVSGKFHVGLSCEIPRAKTDIAKCPVFSVADGHLAAGGFIVVVNDTPGVLLESKHDGLEPVADLDIPATLKGKVKGKPLFVYKTRNREAEPVFDVVTKALFPMVDTIADRAQMLTVIYEGGEEITRIVYTIKNNGRQFLRMAMPAGCKMLSVSVDSRRRAVSEKDGLMLIPLEDSIQTLGGLVPFPVEVIYCRQATRLASGEKMRIDLPELPDVPVAVVKAKLFYPNKLAVKNYRSSLLKTDKVDWREEGSVWMGPTAGKRDANKRFNDALLYNSYQAGYRAYRENRLEDAEVFFAKTIQSAQSGGDLSVASADLLSNIKAGRGEVLGRDKLEKAQISAIQGSLSGMNDQLETQQSQLITAGLANIAEGDEEVGAELLKEAEKIGAQVASRGGSKLRQTSVRKHYWSQLKAVEDDRKKNRDLEKQLEKLQSEARNMTKNAPVQARRLGKGLLSAAAEQNLSPQDMQVSDIAWGQPRAAVELSAGARAQAVQQQISASGKAPSFTQKKEKGLKYKNRKLRQKVSMLEKALSFANSSMSEGMTWGADDSGYVSKSLNAKREAVSNLKKRVSGKGRGKLAMNDYIDYQKDLQVLKEQVAASKLSFQGVGGKVDRDFMDLEQQLEDVEEEVSKQGDDFKSKELVVLNLTNAIDTANYNTAQSFQRYIVSNYADDQVRNNIYEVKGENMTVRNSGGEADRLSEVIEKFADNAGNAVQFSGRRMKLDAGEIPALGGWFTNATATSAAYAIIDEAQYQTLAFAEADDQGGADGSGAVEAKDVIVGTSNVVGGATLTLANADAAGNGILINGENVFLGHDQYYAMADESGITVIKGGAVHNWQEEVGDAEMSVEVPYKVEIPTTGTQMSFEKTLLSAGESPDIEIVFES